MSARIEEILYNNTVDGVIHTHVSMIHPKGKYQFTRQKLEEFWELYMTKIYEEKECIIGIAEKPQHYLPVLVDIDLKIKDDGNVEFGEHLYSKEQVECIIEIYQSVLRSIVEDCNDNNLLCVLLEKNIYFLMAGEISYVKNGFHLHFPNLFLSKIDQEMHLIPRVKELVKEQEIFSNLGIEDSGSVIDKGCCTVPWLLYGSRKSEDMDPYKLSLIYDADRNEISLEDAFKHYLIFDIQEKPINIRNNIEKYIPRILSIIPYGRQTHEIRHEMKCKLKNSKKQDNSKNREKFKDKVQDKVKVEKNLEISAKLLKMLDPSRSEDYNEWMTIGWVLYNIGEGCDEALDQWLEFSSNSDDKYDDSKCIYEWDRMIKKDFTIGTLKYFAEIDNPELYKKFKLDEAEPYIKESLNGSHNDIAKILYAEYGTEFVCSSISNKTWYQYRENHWEEIEEGVFLREKLSDDIVKRYNKIGSECYSKLDESDKAENTVLTSRLKQIEKIRMNLKSSPYKTNVMKEAMEVFYDRRFRHKLDQNAYTIGFKNGIYDLKLNEFRLGRPEDFISKTLPIDYKEYDEIDEDVQNVKDFLVKVFPDESLRIYFLDVYSDIFVGGNTQKKVYMWTGEGDNAKSITQKFFELMLGELAIKFNTQYFTGKKVASGSANPELSRAAPPVRHVTMEEPDADEQLNIGELKKLSGGDSFWARDLFEKGKNSREVFPFFTLTFVCNKLPKLKYSDKATWNRIRVIPFESTFVEPDQECPLTFEEQIKEKRFPMDKEFSRKIPDMVSAFAWYLLEWRKKVTVRIEPEKVKQATEIYRKQNDIYRQYLEECLIEDTKSKISLLEMYSTFKDWFREGFSNMSLPIKNELKEYFEKLWGEPAPGIVWKGYKLRTLQDDLDEGNAFILEKDDLINYDDDNLFSPPL